MGILGISGWSTPAVESRPIVYTNWDDRGAQPKSAFEKSADCTPCLRVTRWYLEDVEVDRLLPPPHDPRVVQSLAFIRGLHKPQSIIHLPKQVDSNRVRTELNSLSRCLRWIHRSLKSLQVTYSEIVQYRCKTGGTLNILSAVMNH